MTSKEPLKCEFIKNGMKTKLVYMEAELYITFLDELFPLTYCCEASAL